MVTGSLGLRFQGLRHSIGLNGFRREAKTSKYRISHSPESLVFVAVCQCVSIPLSSITKSLSEYPRLGSDSDAL
ncbi:hypothetical protein P692DRAFT_20827829 [Suillus brevipes Sb2]|nr:hypothetical protein P692DRAFT_20827829 [Suillus brevipes Sb2]